jgi:hypothetical protein
VGDRCQVVHVLSPVGRRAEALRQLPAAHSLALRLRDAGLPDELIAECLHIEPVALGPLLIVARAKVAAILARTVSE